MSSTKVTLSAGRGSGAYLRFNADETVTVDAHIGEPVNSRRKVATWPLAHALTETALELVEREAWDEAKALVKTEPLLKNVRLREVASKKSELEAEARKIEDGIVVGPSEATLKQVYDEWLPTCTSRPRTIEKHEGDWRRWIQPELGDVKVQKLTTQKLLVFLLGIPRSRSTVKSVEGTLTKILGHARFMGLLDSNPMRDLADYMKETGKTERGTPNIRERIASQEEIRKLLEAASPQTYGPVLIGLLTGARQNEILGMQWGDLDLSAHEWTVSAQLSRATKDNPARREKLKTHAGYRTIPLAGQALSHLKKRKADQFAKGLAGESDFVFCTEGGNSLYYRNLLRGFQRACRLAGIEDLTFHDLRRTCASILIGAGRDVVYVQKFLGHSDPTVTLSRYSRLFEAQKKHEETLDELDAATGAA